jgi:hypothetical protein
MTSTAGTLRGALLQQPPKQTDVVANIDESELDINKVFGFLISQKLRVVQVFVNCYPTGSALLTLEFC